MRVNAGGQNEQNIKAQNYIQFNNKIEGLDVPFPKGIVRIFKKDKTDDNSLEFVGEASINHTPKNSIVTLNYGSSFDIQSNKLVTEYVNH